MLTPALLLLLLLLPQTLLHHHHLVPAQTAAKTVASFLAALASPATPHSPQQSRHSSLSTAPPPPPPRISAHQSCPTHTHTHTQHTHKLGSRHHGDTRRNNIIHNHHLGGAVKAVRVDLQVVLGKATPILHTQCVPWQLPVQLNSTNTGMRNAKTHVAITNPPRLPDGHKAHPHLECQRSS